METYISFLRGINVGGANKIKMADLKGLYEAMGFKNVRTVLQSGNVVFQCPKADRTRIEANIEGAIARTHKLTIATMVRSAVELSTAIKSNPFLSEATRDPSRVVVMFLAKSPGERAFIDLKEAHRGPEQMLLVGPELYVDYCDGIGRSKLNNSLIEKKLGVSGTARNWNTVTKLAAITADEM